MSSGLVIIALGLIALGAILHVLASLDAAKGERGRYVSDERRWMPAEIADGELLASEQQLYATLDGRTIPVRPDQVYLTPDGLLLPVDTKTRAKATVYTYDLIELSLQQLALSESPAMTRKGRPVDRGYIRVKDKAGLRRPSYHRVQLWSRERLEALARRYHGIVSGVITPAAQDNPKACAGCGYRERCPKRAVYPPN